MNKLIYWQGFRECTKPVSVGLMFIVLLFSSHRAPAQNENIDSLKQIVDRQQEDTTYVNACISLAWEYMYSQTDSAEFFAQKGLTTVNTLHNKLLEANCYNTIGVSYIVRGDYADAQSNLNKGLTIMKNLLGEEPNNRHYKRRILSVYANIGNVHYYLGEYSDAIDNYLHSLKYSEEIGFNPGKANCLSNIGSTYKDMNNYPKALEYNYKSLALAKETGDSFLLSQSLNNLGAVYYSVPDYDSARYYFKASMKIFEEEENNYELINSYVNIGNVFRSTQKYDSALLYYNKGMTLSKELASKDGLINVHYMLGQLYATLNQNQKAVNHFSESIRLAEETKTNRFVMLASEEMATIYEKMGNYKNAFDYLKKGNSARDSIFNAEHDRRIAELETKYRTREKEVRITLLTEKNALAEAKAKNRLILFASIIIILAMGLLTIVFAYFNYRNRQKANRLLLQQKAERKILDAVVNTEFKERRRFAEELHDAMGALLSTLKIYINELGDNKNPEEERKNMLQQANNLLDEAIANARNISHNIMPASLTDNGLEYSLRSFIEKINASGALEINLNSSNLKERYEPVVELSVYRMLTEMMNNTLKHAEASVVEISITEKNNKLYVTYKDNGKGFDYELMLTSDKKGLGLENILSRIKLINGKYTVFSKEKEGFSVAVEIPV